MISRKEQHLILNLTDEELASRSWGGEEWNNKAFHGEGPFLGHKEILCVVVQSVRK